MRTVFCFSQCQPEMQHFVIVHVKSITFDKENDATAQKTNTNLLCSLISPNLHLIQEGNQDPAGAQE